MLIETQLQPFSRFLLILYGKDGPFLTATNTALQPNDTKKNLSIGFWFCSNFRKLIKVVIIWIQKSVIKYDTLVDLIRNNLIAAVLPTHNLQQKPLRHKLCPTKHGQYHNTVENSSVRQGAKTFEVFLKSNCDTIQNSYF